MTGKLVGISGIETVRALKKSTKLSYKGISKKGHVIFGTIGRPFNISIPLHKELSRYLLQDQLKLAEITKDEFFKLLGKKK